MRKQLTKSRVIGYLLLLTAASVGVLSVSYARYASQVSGEGTVSVAVWGADTTIEPLSIDVSGLTPGETKKYLFQVTNTKEGKTSQVAQEYSFTVETTENLPLSYNLSEGSSNPAGIGTTIAGSDGTGELVFQDGKAELTGGILPHTTPVTHKYTLSVTWPEAEGGADYADEIDLVTLTVKADQIMPTQN